MFSFLLLLVGSCFCIACSEEVLKQYGSSYSCILPRKTDFVEFSPNRRSQTILWNRTSPYTSGGRVQLEQNVWQLLKLTQADNGYYTFRRKDHAYISSVHIIVEENREFHEKMAGEDFRINVDLDPALCYMTFTPKSDSEYTELMRGGNLFQHKWGQFSGRIRRLSNVPTLTVEIDNLEPSDSGKFEVKDKNRNLVLVAELEVLESINQPLYIGVAVGVFFLVILCCCCMRKCCCKKSSKRDNPVPQTAAAPAVYRDNASQPSGPRYSSAPYAPAPYAAAPYAPASYAPTYPASSSLAPQAAAAATGGEGAAPSVSPASLDVPSSDRESEFKIKGLTSASPLGTDITFCHVYTSDKLNFKEAY